jgi:hypothetical protein
MPVRQRFEHDATRVNLFLFAGLLIWQILHGRGLLQVFFLVGIVKMAAEGFDLLREAGCWAGLVFCTLGFSVMLWQRTGDHGVLHDARGIHILLTATLGAQAFLFLAGRLRRSWVS